jgi:geranylgeranyl diphosphate synthase type II
MTTDSRLPAYLEERQRLVDAALDRCLPPATAFPPTIHEAMRYSVFAGGKRLRPVLTLAAAEAAGGRPDEALPAALAFELIHTYSLIHDDLPCMDDDDLRRGKPTSHKVYGEAIAILAGDALLTHAFRLLGDPGLAARLDAARLAWVLREVADGAGSAGMVGGQVLDIQAEDRAADLAAVERLHRHKTGALIRSAVRAGAIVGGADEPALDSLTRFAEAIGLAFQIVDDILNVEGDPASLGKSAGSDARRKKATYPGLAGLEAARARAAALAAAAQAAVRPLGEQAWPLRALAEFVVARRA